MTILVVGATGMLGGMITRELLGRGKKVRILVRAGSDASALTGAGAEAVTGDLKDASSLKAAVAGCDTVVTTANTAMRGGDDNPDSVDAAGTINLVNAAKDAGVKQFVYMSALGVAPDSPVPLFAAKSKAEAAVKASGMTWTVMKPNLFMEIWAGFVVGAPLGQGKPVTLVGEAANKHSMISAQDVVQFTCNAIDNDAAKNAELVIGGPAAISYTDIVNAFARATGTTPQVNKVAPGTPIEGLPDLIWGTLAALETFESPIPMEEMASKFGVKQTTLDDYVKAALAG